VTARELALRFGLHRVGREWRGRCPCCFYRESFVLTDVKHGGVVAWCASCQDRAAIAATLREVQGNGDAGNCVAHHPADERAERDRQANAERKRERALSLWNGAGPCAEMPAARYLRSRGLDHLVACSELRYRADCPHPSSTRERTIRIPALIARVADADGKFAALQRTFLKRDGSGKADIEPARASLGPIWGGAVRLAPLQDVLAAGELVVGEGIETSACAGLLLGLPAWAAISAGNLAKGLALPPDIRRVVIAADPDAPGEDAARSAWFRWRAEGRAVRVATPHTPSHDFNDVLLAKESRG
jgi:putative DNA primase/helicase